MLVQSDIKVYFILLTGELAVRGDMAWGTDINVEGIFSPPYILLEKGYSILFSRTIDN